MSSDFVGVFSIGQTLDRGLRLYRKALGKAFIFFFMPSIFSIYIMMNTTSTAWISSSSSAVKVGLAYFFSILTGGFASIVVTRYLHRLSLGEEMTLGGIAGLINARDLLFIVTGIIWFVVILLSMLPLFIPFVYLTNLISVALVVCTVERKYFFDGIGRTVKLCKKRWWKTAVINTVAYIIVLVPILVLLGLWTAASAATMLKNTGPMIDPAVNSGAAVSPLAYVAATLYVLGSSLVSPILLTVGVVHYHSLRSEKEGADIEQQMDRIAVPGTGPQAA